MKKFNLKEFQSGILGLTEDLRTVRYIGMNPDGGEYQKLVAVIDGEFIPRCFSLDGKYTKQTHRFDIAYLKSRHQHFIDSYDPEDTWQFKCIEYPMLEWTDCTAEPQWHEDFDYRSHPHNELIKKWKKGAKIEAFSANGWVEDNAPDWYEDTKYRIKSEPEFTYPIYKQHIDTAVVVKFTGLRKAVVIDPKCSILAKGYIENNWTANWVPHTDTNVWKDWTPPTIHCLAYDAKHFDHEQTTPEWHDLTKYPAPDWAKYRAQDEDGEVLDLESEPDICIDHWVDSDNWSRCEDKNCVGTFPVIDNWKQSLIGINELRSKQKPQQPTLPEGFTPYESFLKTEIGEHELVQFIDKLGNISEPKIFSKAFIGKDIIGYKILETVAKPKQDQSTDANQFQYPIYKQDRVNGFVVKFTELNIGEIIDPGTSIFCKGVIRRFADHTDDRWLNLTPIEKPKTKIVHEWMYRLKGSDYFEFVAFSDSDNVFDESHIDRQKTGRSWEVPI